MMIPKIGSKVMLVSHYQHAVGTIYSIISHNDYVKKARKNAAIIPEKELPAYMFFRCPCDMPNNVNMADNDSHDNFWRYVICDKHFESIK